MPPSDALLSRLQEACHEHLMERLVHADGDELDAHSRAALAKALAYGLRADDFFSEALIEDEVARIGDELLAPSADRPDGPGELTDKARRYADGFDTIQPRPKHRSGMTP